MSVHHFNAKNCAVGINRCIDAPQKVTEALGGQTHIQVKGTIRGKSYRSNLAPRGDRRHRLFVHGKIWRKLRVDIGDVIEVELERDDDEWQVDLPTDPAQAMPNRKRFVDRIEEAKSPETRRRRIEQGIQLLIERLRKQRER